MKLKVIGKTKKKGKYGALRGKRTIDRKIIFFKSRMEYNYYTYLLWLQKQGEIIWFSYEPILFDFIQPILLTAGTPQDKWRSKKLPATRFYIPDFMVWEPNGKVYFVETMGMERPDYKRKFDLMEKFYPGIEIRTVSYKDYKELEKQVSPMIPEWEKPE